MSELTKPNAFVFKALIENEYKLCLCPRIDNKWSENDIVFIKDENAAKMFDDVLDNILFSILFVGYEDDPTGVGGIKLLNTNSRFMRSDKDSAQDLYQRGMFFTTVEKGYQQFYEQPESSGQRFPSTPSEQESVQ